MNWGPGAQGGFQNALATGLQIGQMVRQGQDQRNERNALAAYAKDPSEANFGGLADVRPDIAFQVRGQQASQADAARKQQMEQMGQFRQLLDQAGTNPQQAFAAAQQMGIDLSGIPQPGTPEFEPWRQQQLFILNALEKEGDNLPGLAQEVMLALPEGQRDPNSPAFRQAFTAALENKYAAEYTDAQGNTRRRAIIGQPQAPQGNAQQGGEVPVVPADMFQADVQSIGLQKAINFAVSKGLAVPIRGDEDYALLPPGAAFVGPDGIPRRKP
jgi:hypothetical protein